MPSPQTKSLINDLKINPELPLIISDADEVIFELFTHLFEYFDNHGYKFTGTDLVGFELQVHFYSHIENKQINEEDFLRIITAFFDEHGDYMPMVKNAHKNLMHLAKHCQIIILTNAPHDYRQRRVEIYKTHGIDFPIVTNIGNKLPAVSEIIKNHNAPIFFIDDSPEHHISIIANAPHIHCIHFIGDERYAKFVSDVDNVALKSTCWNEVKNYIDTQLSIR